MDATDRELDRGWEITAESHRKIYRLAEPFLRTRLNTLHTRVAYYFARTLLKAEGGDEDIVVPAVLLHDLGWSAVSEEDQVGAFGPNVKRPDLQKLHESEGAKMAGRLLAKLHFPGNVIEQIKQIIDGHDTRCETLGLNDSVVKDADKLWRYTYEGFTIDYKRFNHTPEENLNWLVESIAGWFFTSTAKVLAFAEVEKRKAEYRLFNA